mgnify:CR=1 FL=1
MAIDTLPKLLKRDYERYGDKKIALREKDRGIWKRYTWKDCYERARYFFYGLVSLGFEPGDKLAIIGDAKPEVFWAELAAQTHGGIVTCIFTDCTRPEVKFYVEHSDSKFVLAHDQEQVDKLLDIKNELPHLEKVIYWDPKGLWFYEDPILMSFDEVLQLGKEYEKGHPGLFEQEVERGKGEDVAILLYTSGTTALPKGAMVSHAGIMYYGQGAVEEIGVDEKDEWLAFLPMAWVGGQGYDLTASLLAGMTVNFPEKPETVMENIREIGPSGLLFAPTQWEGLSRTIQANMIDAHPLKRLSYRLFLPVGYKIIDTHLNKERINFFWRALHSLAHLIVFRPLLDKLGLLKVKGAITGGAAVSPDMLRLMHAIGINLLQGYGSSDFGSGATHRKDEVKWETAGPPFRGGYIAMTEEGELLVRNDVKWLYGYYKDVETYNERVKGGWFYTGDAGYIRDDGHVIVMDRAKDLRELKGGRRFSPQYTEVRLRFSPFIKNVIAIGGEDKDYVGVIVNIDIENVGRWAEARRIAYTTFTDLSQKLEVIELIGNEIRRVNKNLPEHARIKRFVNLHKELDPDEAELTRTRKIRRTFLEERYSNIVNALYGDKEELEVEVPVTYQDGRKGVIKGSIKVTPVE